MTQVKIAGVWKEVVPFVNIAGQWKDVTKGSSRSGGTWSMFKRPYSAENYHVTLGISEVINSAGVHSARRSFVRAGTGGSPGDVYIGGIDTPNVVIDGYNIAIRGIETGEDEVAGPGSSWKWLSIQFFGNINPDLLAKTAKLNGVRAIFTGASGYDAVNDLTYLTYAFSEVNIFPVDTPLTLQF